MLHQYPATASPGGKTSWKCAFGCW